MAAIGKVGDMTLTELKAVIREVVREEKLVMPWAIQESDMPMGELIDDIFNNIWTPPPGAPSPLELLREDRDR
jgi:hypothetical protein